METTLGQLVKILVTDVLSGQSKCIVYFPPKLAVNREFLLLMSCCLEKSGTREFYSSFFQFMLKRD